MEQSPIFLPHGFIFGLLFLLAAIVSIPLTAAKLEQKLKVPLSGIVRFFAVFLLVAIAISTLPPVTPTAIDNNTSIAAPPLAVSGSDVIAVPSEPAVTPTPTAAPTPTPTPDNKGKLDILTSPEGATITVDGVSKGLSPIEGLSVDAGTHTVYSSLSGYNPQKETVDVANSETKKLLYTLAPETKPSTTSTPEETPTPTEIPTKTLADKEPDSNYVTTDTPKPEETQAPTPEASNYQNAQWLAASSVDSTAVSNDLNYVSDAASNTDSTSLSIYANDSVPKSSDEHKIKNH